MGFPVKFGDKKDWANTQVRRSIVGGMQEGESFTDALGNAAINGLDPFQQHINKGNRRDLPNPGDPSKSYLRGEARLAAEKLKRRRKNYADAGMSMSEGGTVKMAKGGKVCKGMGKASRGGRYSG